MALPDNQLRQIIEAALMAVDEPMSLDRLAGIFLDHERPSPRRLLRETLADIEVQLPGSRIPIVTNRQWLAICHGPK